MKQRLQNHINSISNVGLRIACDTILDTPGFFTCPASIRFHHAYEGGLLAHTLEVCDTALYNAAPFREGQINYDILLTAALWHDYAKIKEYELTEKDYGITRSVSISSVTERYSITDYAKRIHHIQGSAIEFTVAVREQGVNESVIEQVQHCILAHHGRKEWGSPVEPQTLEALILHQADMLSAHYGKTK